MTNNPLYRKVVEAQRDKRRLVAPLMGFPGLNITDCTIKLAQQNYGEHFKVIKALAREYKPDMIFPLMDLSVEANALGRLTIFPESESATVPKSAFFIENLKRMSQINIALDTRLLGYVETVKLMSLGLPENILKGAYVTGPYSLAALLMGADDAAMATVLNEDELHVVCRFATEKIQEYIQLLVAAGVQTVCILEPSAVMLGPDHFARFSASYVSQIIKSYKYANISTIYHTCGNTMAHVEKMVESGVNALSLDSREAGVDLLAVAQRVPSDVIVMGNINPTGTLLNGTPQGVESEVLDLLEQMSAYPNFVLSTGCDMPQETSFENIRAFMEAARK